MYGAMRPFDPAGELLSQRSKGKLGRVFFVDCWNGSDSNEGTDPEHAFLTMLQALAACTSGNNDYIFLLAIWTETNPIVISKQQLHIIGLEYGAGMPQRMNATGDYAIFDIEVGYNEFAGMALNGGTNHAAIEFTVSNYAGRSVIRECQFGHTGVGKYGVWMKTGENPEIVVEDCIFGDGLTSDGILVATASTRSIFRRNLIRAGGIGINIATSMALGWILDNRILASSDADGKAIKFSAGVDCSIDNNSAFYGTGAVSNELFQDLGTNHWGINYEQNVAVLPKTT